MLAGERLILSSVPSGMEILLTKLNAAVINAGLIPLKQQSAVCGRRPTLPDGARLWQTVPNRTTPCHTVSNSTRQGPILPHCTRVHQIVTDCTSLCPVVQACTKTGKPPKFPESASAGTDSFNRRLKAVHKQERPCPTVNNTHKQFCLLKLLDLFMLSHSCNVSAVQCRQGRLHHPTWT